MKVIILAAGQGTRLRPLTDEKPKCMVKINGRSILERQLETMHKLDIKDEDIYILTGYRDDVLREALKETKIHFIKNEQYESTNMVYTLMCAKEVLEKENDVIVSYGDIIYTKEVLKKLLRSENELSVVVDHDWHDYWAKRCENPLDDAETLVMDENKKIIEIGQKTDDLTRVQSQYIGLMRYQNSGINQVLSICEEAKRKSDSQEVLGYTNRIYQKMYMTDMLQGLIGEGNQVQAIEIHRGWYEVDCCEDLNLVEKEVK